MKFKKILAGLLSATIIFSLGTSLALNQEDALKENTAGHKLQQQAPNRMSNKKSVIRLLPESLKR